jgi:hypothetical protein
MSMANAVVRGSLISIGLAGALCALAAQAAGDTYVVPGSKAAELESCVEPTEFMRRNHMELIKHQRDETVHNGIRSTKHSIAGCIDCHVSYGGDKQPVPVNADGQFCNACHDFAAVGLNCFDCHATVPAYTDTQAAAEVARGGFDWHPPLALTLPGEGLMPVVPGEGN